MFCHVCAHAIRCLSDKYSHLSSEKSEHARKASVEQRQTVSSQHGDGVPQRVLKLPLRENRQQNFRYLASTIVALLQGRTQEAEGQQLDYRVARGNVIVVITVRRRARFCVRTLDYDREKGQSTVHVGRLIKGGHLCQHGLEGQWWVCYGESGLQEKCTE